MSTPIPAFVGSAFSDGTADWAVTVGAGSLQALPSTAMYYLVSNHTSQTEGRSLLNVLKAALDTSSGGNWTVYLSATYKLHLQVNSAINVSVLVGKQLAYALGIAATPTATTITVVSNGNQAIYDAPYFSPLWWTPNQVISDTGPVRFDPAVNYAHITSVGTAQRSSSMVAAYTKNQEQAEAEFIFRGVQYYYKIRPQSGFVNYDLQTFWSYVLSKGRKILFWRNRDNATLSESPAAGSSSPYNYIVYQPKPELREAMLVQNIDAPGLYLWDVRFPLWVTDAGEAVLG